MKTFLSNIKQKTLSYFKVFDNLKREFNIGEKVYFFHQDENSNRSIVSFTIDTIDLRVIISSGEVYSSEASRWIQKLLKTKTELYSGCGLLERGTKPKYTDITPNLMARNVNDLTTKLMKQGFKLNYVLQDEVIGKNI